ncbi:gamma-glutamylcyclotransferase family protein [Herbiconiux sp. P17]|uniref:gamma-glutamylcyclotransferase family protein n=1 Tax=Herbiconiux wuyangfengii TaxID=3342794 RepID=UPI0035B72C6D
MEDADGVLLFSYGTLRQPEVQLATFGRLLTGHEATVLGYRLDWLTITDPAVIATSGSDRHPLLVRDTETDRGSDTDTETETETDGTAEPVSGTVFEITADELLAADAYEVDDYTRVLVPLDSGEQAWVYVFAGEGT